MSAVWVVEQGEYSDRGVVAVFTELSDAMAYCGDKVDWNKSADTPDVWWGTRGKYPKPPYEVFTLERWEVDGRLQVKP